MEKFYGHHKVPRVILVRKIIKLKFFFRMTTTRMLLRNFNKTMKVSSELHKAVALLECENEWFF